MELYFTREMIEAFQKSAKSKVFKDKTYGGLTVDHRSLHEDDFELIKRVLSKAPFDDANEGRRILRQLKNIEELADDREKPIGRLENLCEALRVKVGKLPHYWLFKVDGDIVLPYFCEGMKFHPSEGSPGSDRYVPSHVKIVLRWFERGALHSLTERVEQSHIAGKVTVSELLSKLKLFPETPEMVATHKTDVEKYEKHVGRLGDQYQARGYGQKVERSWRGSGVSFELDGRLAKVVMDDEGEEERRVTRGERHEGSSVVSAKFWTNPGADGDDDDVRDSDVVVAPLHPFVKVFHLSEHCFVITHIANLEPYPYDVKLGEKLVLPERHRKLIDTLMSAAISKMDDIVQGKATGVIVLCSGSPGTGKTLTAEVYSEVAKRPLYMVQCSQLGTDEETIEKYLQVVLARAVRWRAILLIDEADVYIYERGDDIRQNAIVGVFLRLLEYYNGILFMTTNRATIVDDAILSRVTAHVRYSIPEGGAREKLWAILLRQYGVSMDVERAVKLFPKVSGRSIRQLIRLAKFMADSEKVPVDVRHLNAASEFHDFTEEEK